MHDHYYCGEQGVTTATEKPNSGNRPDVIVDLV